MALDKKERIARESQRREKHWRREWKFYDKLTRSIIRSRTTFFDTFQLEIVVRWKKYSLFIRDGSKCNVFGFESYYLLEMRRETEKALLQYTTRVVFQLSFLFAILMLWFSSLNLGRAIVKDSTWVSSRQRNRPSITAHSTHKMLLDENEHSFQCCVAVLARYKINYFTLDIR